MSEVGAVHVSTDLALDPDAAFQLGVDELVSALARHGIQFEGRSRGQVTQGDFVVGRVKSWKAGKHASITWSPMSWDKRRKVLVELRVEAVTGGARVTIVQHGLGDLIGDAAEQAGWFASEVAAPFLRAMTPAAFGDWITDRRARRPAGAQSRSVYGDPLYHYPNFHVILAELELTQDDHLLEVGCGGGALLEMALRSGCRAAGVDHSPDMVKLAREKNSAAIAQGRLEIVEGSAGTLPFPDEVFSCAAMTGVLGFLPDPVAALREIRRTLAPRGRVVIMGADPENRDTPAAPEPMASRLNFYDDNGLAELGRAAGFASIRVVERDLEPYARRSGIPEEMVPLFSGGTRFLLASRE